MKTIKDLLQDTQKTNVIVGAANPLIAELIQRSGFDGLWLSSFEMHAWNLLPDANILSTADYSDAINKISDRVNIPILVDADEGGPSSINTIRMVREYEKSGASGMCFEDNPSPKRCSFYGMKLELEKPKVMCGKIRAAVDKRLNKDFAIIARTEALIQKHGIKVAIERAKMYTDSGCDGFLIHSKSDTPKEIFEFANEYHKANIKTPLVCVPTTYNCVTLFDLKDHGYSLVIYANYSVRATVKYLEVLFNDIIQSNTLSSGNKNVCSMKKIFDLIRVDILKENQKKYGS